jgi:hypothetical protein
MARFVMANRRAGKFTSTEKLASRGAMAMPLSAFSADLEVVRSIEPDDPEARQVVVFDAEPEVAARMASTSGQDVIVEPEILHATCNYEPMDFLAFGPSTGAGGLSTGSGQTLSVHVKSGSQSLEGADVYVFFRGVGGATTRQVKTTGVTGKVRFTYSSVSWSPAAISVAPAGNYWAMVVNGPSSSVVVDCPKLPVNGPLGWWHDRLGIATYKPTLGSGINVGIVDTGLGTHGDLAHATNVGSFIDAIHDPNGGADVASHGTHVAGIVGARPPASSRRYAGIAPGANLFAARVFRSKDAGANQGDIASAIDELSKVNKVDLLNLSLGATDPSQIERDAIVDALERGTVCVAAAGNSAGSVNFPAAFDEVLAISCLGLRGWGPPGSLSATRMPIDPLRFGDDNLYLANFSCFGSQLDGSGPGVGYISTVPERFGLSLPYGVMDGTSMASPAACGALAVRLSQSTPYLATPRDITRANLAKRIFRDACRDLGMQARFQGRGLAKAQ